MMPALVSIVPILILFVIVILIFRRCPAADRVGIGIGIKITNRIKNRIRKAAITVHLLAGIIAVPLLAMANDLSATFDAANRLYEQGKFTEAAATYEKLAQSNPRSATLYFNLGNAWFKAGQLGRAIAAWRLAERLEPRDPSLRFNLAFARKKVTGSEAPLGSLWNRALKALTVNEWTGLASAGLWGWFLLLALREWRPAWRRALSGYTATVGVAAALLMGCLAAAANQQFRVTSAVVAVPEAIVRIGPLEEAQPTRFQFRDGNELTVLDQKEIAVGGQSQLWLYVRDAAGRTGWLKSDQIVLLPAGRASITGNQ